MFKNNNNLGYYLAGLLEHKKPRLLKFSISKYNPGTFKDIALLSLKDINSYNIIPLYQNSIFVSIFLSGG